METLVAMVEGVKALGMETCMTLGMLTPEQSATLADAGLDYYNHNIDTSERYYSEVISTRTFADRLETLANVRDAGIKVCAGGILGMGETVEDRISMLVTLANLPVPPESVPINMLIPIPGTNLADAAPVDPIDFVRTIALARILMPRSHVRGKVLLRRQFRGREVCRRARGLRDRIEHAGVTALDYLAPALLF